MQKALKSITRGTPFHYAGQCWIPLEHDASGRTLCLAKDIIERCAFDAMDCNDWSKSSSRYHLNGPFLDSLIDNLIDKAVFGSAFLESEVNLTSDDGLRDYGTCDATIFLLSVDQYRRNRDIIPPISTSWWLVTALSTDSNGYESSTRVVDCDGTLDVCSAFDGKGGLRPACYMDSGLMVSSKECATDEYAEAALALAKEWGQYGYTLEEVVRGATAYAQMLWEKEKGRL